MSTRGHLEMTPIYLYRHFESLFKQILSNRTQDLVTEVDVTNRLWTQEEMWGQNISHIEDVLKDFREKIEKTGYIFGSGRCMAYVPNSGNLASCMGDLLLGQMDPWYDQLSKSIDHSVIQWMCRIVGYPKGSDGYLTSGGTTASVIAMAAARDSRGIKSADYHKQVIYCTARTHTALDKALETVGMGMALLYEVKHDDQQRMIPHELEKAIKRHKEEGLNPFVVVGTTGTTDLGSIDPMPEIAEIVAASKADNQPGIWFHVDGAIGGFYAMCPQMEDLFKGIEESDSLILDPHKSLSQPYGCGGVLLRKAAHKGISCVPTPEQDGKIPPWQSPIENRMMFRSYVIWFSVQALGIKTFRTVLERNLELAQYVYDQMKHIQQLYVMEPQLSTVVFRWAGDDPEVANAKTRLLIKEMEADERVCLSTTRMDEFDFIRICITNYRDHLSEIKLCLDEVYTQMEDILGSSIDRSVKPTTARVDWLKQVEKDLRWKEHDLATKFLDRILRQVYNEVIHGDVERMKYEISALESNYLWLSEEPIDINELLCITAAITLKEIEKPQCRYAGSIGHLVGVVNNSVTCLYDCAPGAVQLEDEIITFLANSFGLNTAQVEPPGIRGVLASDICTANEVGLLTARQFKFLVEVDEVQTSDSTTEEEKEKKLENRDFSKAVVYTTEGGLQRYATEVKVIGLGDCHWTVIKQLRKGALDIEDLKAKITADEQNPDRIPWVVIQPLDGYWERSSVEPVSDLCDKLKVWHHVEVGWRTSAQLFNLPATPESKPLKTNSVAVNIQQGLSLPVGMAAIMVTQHDLLYSSMTHHRNAAYLPAQDHKFEPEYYSFELSRPCRVVPLWFTLRLMGTKICCAPTW